MASNLAIASQCAAVGVPRVYPGRHVRTKIATKSSNQYFTAAKPLVMTCEVGFPVSGNPIQGGSAAKRGDQIKMMTAAIPTPTTAGFDGIDASKRYTDVELFNETFKHLDFYDKNYPSGTGEPPREILARQRQDFRQDAGPVTGDSIGGVAYTITGKLKWIVAWRNLRNGSNKVYTEITAVSEIDWEDIFNNLLPKSHSCCETVIYSNYRAIVHTDTYSVTPTVKGTLIVTDP